MKPTRIIGALLGLFLMFGGAPASAETDISEIHVVTPAWEDQTQSDGTGLFFDILRAVYEPTGIRMRFQILPWKRAEKMLASGRADARPAIVRNSPDQVMPTYPLYVDYTVAIFKKETEWHGMAALEGGQCVWPRGYGFNTFAPLSKFTLHFTEVDRPGQAWKMLREGRADFYIDALIDVERYIRKQNINTDPFRIETLYSKNAYVQFADTEKSRRLMAIWDQRIMDLYRSGALKTMFDKWMVQFSAAPYEAAPPAPDDARKAD